VTGRYIVILRRQTDGSWKMVRGIDNSPTPPTPTGGL
jgi:ketosteroid isomerase-like protein